MKSRQLDLDAGIDPPTGLHENPAVLLRLRFHQQLQDSITRVQGKALRFHLVAGKHFCPFLIALLYDGGGAWGTAHEP